MILHRLDDVTSSSGSTLPHPRHPSRRVRARVMWRKGIPQRKAASVASTEKPALCALPRFVHGGTVSAARTRNEAPQSADILTVAVGLTSLSAPRT